MGLKFGVERNTSKIVWGAVLVILGLCLLRVALWENGYYASKEGSERTVTQSEHVAELANDGNENLDETEPTEVVIREYIVAADKPRYLSIEQLNINNARVLEMGLTSTGQLRTPNNIFDVGWYYYSARPGAGGTLLIDGHNGGPNKYGVFKYLPDLAIGARIKIERGDGAVFFYEVKENETVPLNNAGEAMHRAQQSPVEGVESLSLITCTGEWSQVQQTYLSRQFVRAVLVEEHHPGEENQEEQPEESNEESTEESTEGLTAEEKIEKEAEE